MTTPQNQDTVTLYRTFLSRAEGRKQRVSKKVGGWKPLLAQALNIIKFQLDPPSRLGQSWPCVLLGALCPFLACGWAALSPVPQWLCNSHSPWCRLGRMSHLLLLGTVSGDVKLALCHEKEDYTCKGWGGWGAAIFLKQSV